MIALSSADIATAAANPLSSHMAVDVAGAARTV